MWSRRFECCVKCGGTAYKHVANGICNSCYQADYRSRHRVKIAEQKHDWYLLQVNFLKRKLAREARYFAGKREAILERDGRKCTQCGATTKLIVHHKDGNGRGSDSPNNDDENLTTLCRACHLEVHRKELQAGKTGALIVKPHTRKPPYKPKPITTWTRHFDACVVCGKTDSPHSGKGVCNRCSLRERYRLRKTV